MNLKFEILDENLRPVAKVIAEHYKNKKYRILCEKTLREDYSFRPTLICKKGGENVAIEVMREPAFPFYFESFMKDCLVKREDLKIYLAFPYTVGEKEIAFTRSFSLKAKEYGIGILLVKDNRVIEDTKAIKCYMRITMSEFGNIVGSKGQICNILDKFNEGQFVDAIRDITELVEDIVDRLAIKAAKKRKIVPTSQKVDSLDFEGKINLLSAPQWQGKRQKRYFSEDLKDDLKSFKRARILSHHPRNRKEEKKLEKQSLERMRMGIRLVQEICKIKA